MTVTSFPGRIIIDHVQKTGGQALAKWLAETLGTECVSPNLIGFHSELIGSYGGIHSIIISHVLFFIGEKLNPRYQYITCLRDPVDRALSWIFFLLHDVMVTADSEKKKLAARIFLESDGEDCPIGFLETISNVYVDHFSTIGYSGRFADNFKIPEEEKLAAALAAIRQYDVVGIYEDFPRFVMEVASLVGTNVPAQIGRVNVSSRRPQVHEISPKLRERIIELNQNDLRFYTEIVEWKKGKALPVPTAPLPKDVFGWEKHDAKASSATVLRYIPSAGSIGSLSFIDRDSSMNTNEQKLLRVTIANQSSQDWRGDALFPINIGYHWLRPSGETYLYNGQRTPLPKEGVSAGTSISIDVSVLAPGEAGSYTLVLTMVQEGIAWLEKRGFEPAIVQVIVIDSKAST